MTCLGVSACVVAALFGGDRLFGLAARGEPTPHHAWPLVVMGGGLILGVVALGLRVGLCDRGLTFRRGPRLVFLGGLTVGTTLVLVGLFAALTTLL